ncbi:MAG: hypothetical protein KAW45_05410 [Thermoplasmatales archaeon]|nr:hypothetical protein [Thermoplasmatales archaeon]
MKLKILTIVIMLIMVCSVFVVSADVKQNRYNNKSPEENNTIEIRVAIYDDHLVNNEESSGGKFFIFPLRNYEWKVGDRLYYFTIEVLSTRDILKGKLKASNFDVFIYSWDQADTNLVYTGFSNLPKNKVRVKEIRKFIEDGGGYYGSCGAALIAGDMINEPETFFERAMKKSCLGISCFNINYRYNSFLSQILPGFPLSSSVAEYLFNSGAKSLSGISVDCNISEDSPIFDDLIEKTRRITWIGAPAFIPPEKPDRETMILARFPETEFSDNETTKINHWKYTGGISGLIKAFITPHDEDYWNDDLGRLMDAWVFASDWVNTGKVIKTNIANKPFMTAEIYPNDNQARIVRCSGHPEFKVYWGGHIEDVEDDNENNHYEGFYKWVNVTPDEETIEDEKTYNYCIIRRSLAWASQKVPDNNLPPIYGPSQVSDICPYEQPTSFNIKGNAETADGIESLDLYYKYSPNNETWTDWTFYEKDSDDSDGWEWEFNSPNGTGFYQFYSIRQVEFGGYTETEKAPPGPDAIAFVRNF